ncbi:hypothetical protein AB7M35_003062 [Amorphus suaedae]
MTRTDRQDEGGEASGAVRPEDAAQYIEGISAELSTMARRSGFDFLGYLLDIVREEAAARAMESSGAAGRKLT